MADPITLADILRNTGNLPPAPAGFQQQWAGPAYAEREPGTGKPLYFRRLEIQPGVYSVKPVDAQGNVLRSPKNVQNYAQEQADFLARHGYPNQAAQSPVPTQTPTQPSLQTNQSRQGTDYRSAVNPTPGLPAPAAKNPAMGPPKQFLRPDGGNDLLDRTRDRSTPGGSANPPGTTTGAEAAIKYYNADGTPYAGGEKSYWQRDGIWYQGTKKDNAVSTYGLSAPWDERGSNTGGTNRTSTSAPSTEPGATTPITLQGILKQIFGGELDPSLLSAFQPKAKPQSWLRPGVGYGDTLEKPTYFNEAGRPFRSGEDTKSFWFKRPENKWYSGNLGGDVTEETELPWHQLPWLKQAWETPTSGPNGDQQVSYFNASGGRFQPGDKESFWYNRADKQWYKGDMKGNVTPVTAPPFMGGQ